jgi:hypothetical protein
VIADYRALGAQDCVPIYNALDPSTHFPGAPIPASPAISAFSESPADREARVEEFFLAPRGLAASSAFCSAAVAGTESRCRRNVEYLGHVYTADHNAFNCTRAPS